MEVSDVRIVLYPNIMTTTKFNVMLEINKKYQVILADPPWEYNFATAKNIEIERKYPTMSLSELKNLNIPADDNAVLYLWVTNPKLIEGLELMKHWGFEYKTNLVWDKNSNFGMGYWARSIHELLLIGTKGNFSPPDENKRILSIIRSNRREHSKKPDIIRTLISSWFPNYSKIELFARQRIESWDAWGNEVPKEQQNILR